MSFPLYVKWLSLLLMLASVWSSNLYLLLTVLFLSEQDVPLRALNLITSLVPSSQQKIILFVSLVAFLHFFCIFLIMLKH